MFNRNSIRAKMGKPVFFTLTHCNKKMSGISNKYNYKANMHKLCFAGARFYNVKYQASIMTDCNYRDANIIGVIISIATCEEHRLKMQNLKMWCFLIVISKV